MVVIKEKLSRVIGKGLTELIHMPSSYNLKQENSVDLPIEGSGHGESHEKTLLCS